MPKYLIPTPKKVEMGAGSFSNKECMIFYTPGTEKVVNRIISE